MVSQTHERPRKPLLKKLLPWLAGLLVLVVVGVVVDRSLRVPDRRKESAAEFRRLLLEEIRTADRITVAEHANPMDDGVEGVSSTQDYRTVDLDAAQVAHLEALVAAVSVEPLNEFVACFIPHHAIRFSKGGAQVAELKVCLDCSGLRLSSTHATEPKDLFPRIAAFLADLGFQRGTHEEWRQRAMSVPPEPQ